MPEVDRSNEPALKLAFFFAPIAGSAIGSFLWLITKADSIFDLLSSIIWISMLGLTTIGAFASLIPYMVLAVPECLVLEAYITSPSARTVMLTVAGAITGAAISTATFDILFSWASLVGGWTGLSLGFLRRHVKCDIET